MNIEMGVCKAPLAVWTFSIGKEWEPMSRFASQLHECSLCDSLVEIVVKFQIFEGTKPELTLFSAKIECHSSAKSDLLCLAHFFFAFLRGLIGSHLGF